MTELLGQLSKTEHRVEREKYTTSPFPEFISAKLVRDNLIIKELSKLEQDKPSEYSKLGFGKSIFLRAIDEERQHCIESQFPDLLNRLQQELIRLQRASDIPLLGEKNVSLNLKNNVSLLKADPNLWEQVVWNPVSLYFSGLARTMASMRINANRLPSGSAEARKNDKEKTKIAKLAIQDSIKLGCPEVVYLEEDDRGLFSICIVLAPRGRIGSRDLADTSHVLQKEFRSEFFQLIKAKQQKIDELKKTGLWNKYSNWETLNLL